jgi:hypothetical protein
VPPVARLSSRTFTSAALLLCVCVTLSAQSSGEAIAQEFERYLRRRDKGTGG